jgi:hypothetical protein
VLLCGLLYLKSSASHPWLIYACVHVRLARGGHRKAQLRFKETTSLYRLYRCEDALAESALRTAPVNGRLCGASWRNGPSPGFCS